MPQNQGHGPPTVSVNVVSPKEVEPKPFTWPQNTKVGEAAAEAAAAFGYAPGGNPTFRKGHQVLKRDKPLVAEGVQDGDELELVDVGGGV